MAPPARSPGLGRAVRGNPFTRPDSAGTPTLAGREEFPPIELSENVRKFLEPITPGGKLEGRLFRVKPWKDWPMAKRIAFIRAFVTDTSRDPAIVEKATRILKEAGVESKDHERAWAALLKWVQENIYYVNERDERLQSPQYTLTERHGDCLPATTPLLRDDFELVPIQAVEPGQRIWGLDRWSTVEAVVDKGELAVDEILLSNGRRFRATAGHKVYVKSDENAGEGATVARIAIADVVEGMRILTPALLPVGATRFLVATDGAAALRQQCRVKEITRSVATVPCFDIQTDDHYVYLPEADVTVSNCDDLLIVFAALGDSLRLPWRAVISGRGPKGVVAWTEGCGPIPAGVSWTHIFGAVGWPPFRPTRWTYAEPTLKVPLGWSVVTRTGGGPARADLGAADAAATPSAPAPAPAPAPTPSSAAQAPGPWISWRQVVSTVTASVLSFWVTRSLMRRR